jgi:hypothetical protein
MVKTLTATTGTIGLLLSLGCGGASQQPAANPSSSASETAYQSAATPTPTEEGPRESVDAENNSAVQAPKPVGPASITVAATVQGKPVAARVRLVNEGGKTEVEGQAGEKLSIPSGKYEAVVQVEAKALVDQPVKRLSLELSPGQNADEQVSFPWAKIKLNVKVNGRLDRDAKVQLIREGKPMATIKSADADYVPISPGRYQAVVTTRNTKTTVDNIMFPEGATQDVPVEVQF